MTDIPTPPPATVIYALSCWDEGYVLRRSRLGVWGLSSGDDVLWDDCDFDGLSGLVVWEGTRYTKEEYRQFVWDGDPDEFGDFWDDGWDSFAIGNWRRMRADEAVALGFLAPAGSADR